eukprot:scaffold1073_cov383-Prasinococcus_capsulatus_cf.AAC.5
MAPSRPGATQEAPAGLRVHRSPHSIPPRAFEASEVPPLTRRPGRHAAAGLWNPVRGDPGPDPAQALRRRRARHAEAPRAPIGPGEGLTGGRREVRVRRHLRMWPCGPCLKQPRPARATNRARSPSWSGRRLAAAEPRTESTSSHSPTARVRSALRRRRTAVRATPRCGAALVADARLANATAHWPASVSLPPRRVPNANTPLAASNGAPIPPSRTAAPPPDAMAFSLALIFQ